MNLSLPGWHEETRAEKIIRVVAALALILVFYMAYIVTVTSWP